MIHPRRWSSPAIPILCSGVLFAAGCGPGGSTNAANSTKFENFAPATSSGPASPPSAEPNSFDEVTARLDRGGALYLYLSTSQWLEGLSAQLTNFRSSLPKEGMSAQDRKNMDQMFDLGTSFIKSSGLEQITGVGASSLALDPGVYRNTFFVHHYKGKEMGFLNSLFGTSPHALGALNLLPANTALASSGDYDIAGLVHAVFKTIDESGTPEMKQGKAESLQKFQQSAGMTLDDLLASLGYEIDLILTLDPSKMIDVPAGDAGTVKIPTPRLALLIEVKDDKLFNKVDETLKQIPGIIQVDEPGLKMRTTSYPLLPDFELRGTVARWDKYLLIASDDHLVRDMIAVQKGGAGLKASPAFAALSAGVPSEGNGFSLTTKALMDTIRKVQTQFLAQNKGSSPAQSEWINKLLLSEASNDSYSVSAHVENGWLAVNKGSAGVGKVLAPLVVLPVAIAAGSAFPAFTGTSQTGKATQSMAKAKQIALACKLYAGDNNGNYPPTLMALIPMYFTDAKLLVSPFAPEEAIGYLYTPGLMESSPPETIVVEDKFAPKEAKRVVVRLDGSGEVLKQP